MREAAGNWTDYREIVAGIRELAAIIWRQCNHQPTDKNQ